MSRNLVVVFHVSNVFATEVVVCLGEAQGTESGEKMIVWRQDGRTCRRGFKQSSRERGVDAGFAATSPVRDFRLERSPPDVVPEAQPKRTTTGVADSPPNGAVKTA
jgi:hypothetical protein